VDRFPDRAPYTRYLSTSTRVLAGSILGIGLAVAVLLPTGHVCTAPDAVEVRRQWSYSEERWSYGCWLSEEVFERGTPFMPTDARTDWRIPFRAGAVVAGLLIAWMVVGNDRRLVATDRDQAPPPWATAGWTRVSVALYAFGGAVIALLLTLRHDSYCILFSRAPGGLSCSYRSFFGWDAEPILVEILFTVIGAAGGAVVGVLIARLASNQSETVANVGDLPPPSP